MRQRCFYRPAIAFFIALSLGLMLGYCLQGSFSLIMATVLAGCLVRMGYSIHRPEPLCLAPLAVFFSKHLVVDSSALQRAALQYLGMPILAGVAILLLVSFLNTLVTAVPAEQLLEDIFRFALVTALLCVGANGSLHALFVWPQGVSVRQMKLFHFLTLLPSFLFLVVGGILMVRFFQFS